MIARHRLERAGRVALQHENAALRADLIDLALERGGDFLLASSVMIVMRSSGCRRRQARMALRAPGRSSGSMAFGGETVGHGE